MWISRVVTRAAVFLTYSAMQISHISAAWHTSSNSVSRRDFHARSGFLIPVSALETVFVGITVQLLSSVYISERLPCCTMSLSKFENYCFIYFVFCILFIFSVISWKIIISFNLNTLPKYFLDHFLHNDFNELKF